jgi:thioredoxin
MALTVTDSTFENEIINSPKLGVVDFWAPWCGPCIALGPTIDQLAKEYEGKVNVAKINVDENPETSIKFGITSIPCVLFFKDGKLVDKQVGVAPKAAYESKIKSHLSY